MSIGYGPDSIGKFSMNFGPLNKKGGERRLNVAITRAKCRMLVFSSFDPEEIDTRRTKSEGMKMLQKYMIFARDGEKLDKPTDDIPDFGSPFEESVCKALEDKGLQLDRQVGCAGYRIDLAVVHPRRPGEYLLAIECDGATYHSSKTARDRDRLRQSILEEMGWKNKILRIWSTDWWKYPPSQIDRVLWKLEELGAGKISE